MTQGRVSRASSSKFSYIVYFDETDGRIKAKKVTTGQVQFAGTSAPVILEMVLDALSA
jgi:hypothetical protein